VLLLFSDEGSAPWVRNRAGRVRSLREL